MIVALAANAGSTAAPTPGTVPLLAASSACPCRCSPAADSSYLAAGNRYWGQSGIHGMLVWSLFFFSRTPAALLAICSRCDGRVRSLPVPALWQLESGVLRSGRRQFMFPKITRPGGCRIVRVGTTGLLSYGAYVQ